MKTRNYVLKNCDRTIIKAFQATIFQVIFTFHDFQRKKWKKKSNFSSARQRDEKKKNKVKNVVCVFEELSERGGKFSAFSTQSHMKFMTTVPAYTLCMYVMMTTVILSLIFFFSFLFIISDCLRNVNYQQCTSNEQLKNETKKKKRIREKDTTFSSSRPHNLDIIICRTPMKLK